jgi:hypothetical protein
MTELQSGILQWLAASLAFLLGYLLRGLFDSAKRREESVLALEAERLAKEKQ